MYNSLFFYSITYILLGDNMFKNLYMSLLYFFCIITISTIFITLFNYFNVFSSSVISGLKLAVPLVGIFISSFILGSKSNKLGYVEGLKFGIIIVIIFLIISLLSNSFIVKSLIYYAILILCSTFGAMVGINKKKK